MSRTAEVKINERSKSHTKLPVRRGARGKTDKEFGASGGEEAVWVLLRANLRWHGKARFFSLSRSCLLPDFLHVSHVFSLLSCFLFLFIPPSNLPIVVIIALKENGGSLNDFQITTSCVSCRYAELKSVSHTDSTRKEKSQHAAGLEGS